MKGKFITLEGGEGAGKSSSLSTISQVLSEFDIEFESTREPGGPDTAERIRSLLLDRDCALEPSAELLLMFAARAENVEKVIKPALAAGRWIVCDRFTDASYAYQAGGRGMDANELAFLEKMVHPNLAPDLTILLDVPDDIGLQRATREGEPDRFESEAREFHRRVREAYLRRAQEYPERFRVIDASQSLSEVQAQVAMVVRSLVKDSRHE